LSESSPNEGALPIARDGLALQHEEDESAMRQMLKKFNDKSDEEKTSKAESNAINKVTGHLNALRGMNQSGWLTKSVFHVASWVT